MTNFSDRWETDVDGNRFVFTVEMQRRLHESGLPPEVDYLDQIDLSPEPVAAPAVQQTGDDDDDYDAPPPRREERSEPREREDITGPASIQIDPMTGKYVGRIKWYNARKGYGFILRGADEEIFFHRSGAVGNPDELKDGLWILYDVEETNKGPEATDIEAYENPDGA